MEDWSLVSNRGVWQGFPNICHLSGQLQPSYLLGCQFFTLQFFHFEVLQSVESQLLHRRICYPPFFATYGLPHEFTR